MLANARARSVVSLLFALLLALFLTNSLSLQAQVNGVPPSVTSMGFGGRPINGIPPSVTSLGFDGRFLNGVPPSVTSLGPKGAGNDWSFFANCCSDFFVPAKKGLPLTSGHDRRHRRGDRGGDRDGFAAGVMEPAYVPYAVLYAPDGDGGDSDDVDADTSEAPAPLPPGGRPPHRISVPDANPEVAVTIQPSTVLVFKDGHQSDVINYAIVGDTLFDFGGGRTRKILLADLDLPATHKAN
jgi:hypothetical protein